MIKLSRLLFSLAVYGLGFSLSCKSRDSLKDGAKVKETESSEEIEDDSFVLGKGEHTIPAAQKNHAQFCSFNIQFLGMSARRDNKFLADTVKNCDILAVQELVAHPEEGFVFPDQNGDGLLNQLDSEEIELNKKPVATKGDAESKAFFDEMKKLGFSFLLSDSKSGSGNIQGTSSSAEWSVIFFKDKVIQLDKDFPNGFISDTLKENEEFKRVPYAAGFRFVGGSKKSFALVNVHLHFATKPNNMTRDFLRVKTVAKTLKPLKGSSDPQLEIVKNCTEKSAEFKQFSACVGSERDTGKALSGGDFNRLQRYVELQSIFIWIKDLREGRLAPKSTKTVDWLVIGDMNISGKEEIDTLLSKVQGIRSLNVDASITTSAQGTQAFDHALVKNKAVFSDVFDFPKELKTLSLVCRAALLQALPLEKDNVKPPASSGKLEEVPGGLTCAKIKEKSFVDSSDFLRPVVSDTRNFWTSFRLRYSDHNPVFFEVKIP